MKSNQSPLKRDFKDFALWNVYHEVKVSSALGFVWCVVAHGYFHSQGRKDGTGPEGVQTTQGKMSSPFCERASELSWALLTMCKTWIQVVGTYSISFVSVVGLWQHS